MSNKKRVFVLLSSCVRRLIGKAHGELNKLAQDLILSMDTSSSEGKVAFGLVRNVKSVKFPEGNCKITWDRLVSK